MQTQRAKLLIFSGPSGAGKSTLLKEARKYYPKYEFVVSYTTRPPRPGEIHGVHYFFVSEEVFSKMIADDKFVEWVTYNGYRYGTPLAALAQAVELGKTMLLDIDVNGCSALLDNPDFNPYMHTVFIRTSTIQILRERLVLRKDLSPENIEKRILIAESELLKQHLFTEIVINDDREIATEQICRIARDYLLAAA